MNLYLVIIGLQFSFMNLWSHGYIPINMRFARLAFYGTKHQYNLSH